MPLIRIVAVIGLVGLALVPLGCGSSSSSSSTKATTTTVTSTAAGGNGRLSAASWAAYTSEAAHARAVNQASIKTFRKCRIVAGRGASASQVQVCLGDSMSTVVSEGQKLLATLQRFVQEASGACATAMTNVQGNVKLYISSVNTLQSSVAGEGVGGHGSFPTQLDNTQQILVRTRAAQPPVVAACKPA
jgi:hypothetical protein